MKILLINHFPLEGSGSGVYTKNLALGLVNLGHDVKVLYIDNEEKKYNRFKSEALLFNKGDLEFNFPCFTTHPKSNNNFSKLSDENLKTYVDKFVEFVKKETEKFKPDIIHAQHVWIAPYAASKTEVPYVITAHETGQRGYKEDKRYHKYVHEGIKNAKKIITISDSVDELVNSLYPIDNLDTKVVLNSYNEDVFYPKDINKKSIFKKYGINKNSKYIVGFAGKFTKFKGIDILLKAAKIYENDLNHDVVTILAGDGELKKEMEEFKNTLDLKNVFFVGNIKQEELVDIYNVSDVLAMPSRKEGFGLVAIEALACGTPVVATNDGGIKEFLTKDVGALIDPDDFKSLSKEIKAEITRKDKLIRKEKCSSYAYENFSSHKFIEKIEKIYLGVI